MKLIKWCWGLLLTGAGMLFMPYAFVFALILSAIDNVDLKEKKSK